MSYIPVYSQSFQLEGSAKSDKVGGPFGFTKIHGSEAPIGDPVFVICDGVGDDAIQYNGKRYALCVYKTEWYNEFDEIDEEESGLWQFLCRVKKED